jgi:hypothetical protein
MTQQIFRIPKTFLKILHRLYGTPASVTLVTGKWKTGKTDFSLFLTELTKQEGLIREFASNIETTNSCIQFVNDFQRFDYWVYANRHTKMFLYDEAVESSPRRKAMSGINVGWVQRIPQLSKGRCHLVVIVQEENLADSVFLNPTFNRGLWRKIRKETVVFNARWLDKTMMWENLPRTNIVFDPYLGATFKIESLNTNFQMLPLPLKVLQLYAEGNSFTKIQALLNIEHPNTVKRKLQQACKAVSLTLSQQPTEGNKVIENCEENTNLIFY